jgi:hypothetical protein
MLFSAPVQDKTPKGIELLKFSSLIPRRATKPEYSSLSRRQCFAKWKCT